MQQFSLKQFIGIFITLYYYAIKREFTHQVMHHLPHILFSFSVIKIPIEPKLFLYGELL